MKLYYLALILPPWKPRRSNLRIHFFLKIHTYWTNKVYLTTWMAGALLEKFCLIQKIEEVLNWQKGSEMQSISQTHSKINILIRMFLNFLKKNKNKKKTCRNMSLATILLVSCCKTRKSQYFLDTYVLFN